MTSGDDPHDSKDLTSITATPPAPSVSDVTHSPAPNEFVETFESLEPDHSQLESPPVTLTEPLPSTPAHDPLEDLREYSESVQGSSQYQSVFVPYHLYMSGQFGPHERDKLLLFITENDIGLTSQDLDLQIRSGKVLFPRISEFAGVKLIQEIRDSGLQFKIAPSSRDRDETQLHTEPTAFHYQPETTPARELKPILVLEDDSALLKNYTEMDVLQVTQYLKSEIVEAEKSNLFQDILDRLTEALKQKARIKGGDALTQVKHKVTPLRLPSQYQVGLQAKLLKKRD